MGLRERENLLKKEGRTMTKHALLLADEEWCEAASSGRIKVYDFIKPRKHRIHTLEPGSVCVVMTKVKPDKPSRIYGEFTACEIKEVDSDEYNKLVSKGYIHNPQILKTGEKRWIISFNTFTEYPKKVLKKELKDVRTSTSKKPLSEWVITGLTYIDQQALDAIRAASGFAQLSKLLNEIKSLIVKSPELVNLPFSITHECAEMMLLRIGKELGFHTYTADPSQKCGDTSLKELVDMSRDDLRKYVGERILDPLSRADVIWHVPEGTFYVFEVIIGGDMKDALFRFLNISGLNAKVFIVAGEERRHEYEGLIKMPAFSIIRQCDFISIPQLIKMYALTSLWKQSIDKLDSPL
jgi:hypothetical protein